MINAVSNSRGISGIASWCQATTRILSSNCTNRRLKSKFLEIAGGSQFTRIEGCDFGAIGGARAKQANATSTSPAASAQPKMVLGRWCRLRVEDVAGYFGRDRDAPISPPRSMLMVRRNYQHHGREGRQVRDRPMNASGFKSSRQGAGSDDHFQGVCSRGSCPSALEGAVLSEPRYMRATLTGRATISGKECAAWFARRASLGTLIQRTPLPASSFHRRSSSERQKLSKRQSPQDIRGAGVRPSRRLANATNLPAEK